MHALRIAVISPVGRVVSEGAIHGPRDLYLYSFEIKGLADAYAHDERHSLSELGSILGNLGAKGIDVGLLERALHTGVAHALQTTHAQRSLVPLLLRDLGVHHARGGFDLARPLPPDRIQLDPVQEYVLFESLIGPAVRRNALRHPATARVVAGGCLGLPEAPKREETLTEKASEWWQEKEVELVAKQLSEKLGLLFEVKSAADTLLEAVHGLIIANGLKMKAVKTRLETHYGPAGMPGVPLAGRPVQFQVELTFTGDYSERTIQCFALAGLRIPRPGPVPGVKVAWTFPSEPDDISDHGTLAPDATLGVVLAPTGGEGAEKGISTVTFTPRNELVPGRGFESSATSIAEPVALWGSSFGNTLGKINQLLTPQVGVVIGWLVGFHRQWAFDVTASGNQSGSEKYSVSYKDPQHDQCTYNATGNGTFALKFASQRPTGVVLYEKGGSALTMEPLDQGAPGTAPLGFSASLTEQGDFTLTNVNWPVPPCWDPGGGGEPGSPDCGTKPVDDAASTLDYRSPGTLSFADPASSGEFLQSWTDPFSNCGALLGRDSANFVPITAPIDESQIKDKKQATITTSGRTVRGEDLSPAGGGGTTIDGQLNTTASVTFTLVRRH